MIRRHYHTPNWDGRLINSLTLSTALLWLLLAIVTASDASSSRKSEAPAQRIASLNLCLDQFLLALVDRSRIVSLSYLSADPSNSVYFKRARGITLNHGLAEEVIAESPDLVLAGQYGSSNAVAILRRLGYRVEVITLPRNLKDIRLYMSKMGLLLDVEEQVNRLIADMEERLARLQHQPVIHSPLALIYGPNGVTYGANTLEHELLTLAGYRNLVAELGVNGFRYFPLERLVALRPERLVVDGRNREGFSIAHEYLAHPALDRAHRDNEIVRFPPTLSVCPATFIAPIVEALVKQRE